jgi:hypothetical protein
MLFDLSFTLNGYTVTLVGDVSVVEETAAAVAKVAAMVRSLPPMIEAPRTEASETKVMQIAHIVRSHDGTKEVVRVFGEPWMKFGVSVYPDSCKEGYEMVPTALGTKLVSGYEAIVAMKGDNPSRVVAIRAAAVPF